MSSCSTPWWAEYVSWQTEARIPRILQAATEAPDPTAADEHAAIGLAALDGRPEPDGEVGVVVGRIRAVPAQVEQLRHGRRRSARPEPDQELVLEHGTTMVGGEGDTHRLAARLAALTSVDTRWPRPRPAG